MWALLHKQTYTLKIIPCNFNRIGAMHRIFKNSLSRDGEYVHCTDLVGGAFSSGNAILNPYIPGKFVVDTIKGCGMGLCSGGGVAMAEGMGMKLLSCGSCLKEFCFNAAGCCLSASSSVLKIVLVKL